MAVISLASPTDFEGWRNAARDLRRSDIPPRHVTWMVGQSGFLAVLDKPPPVTDYRPRASAGAPPLRKLGAEFKAPARFVELARMVICNRSPTRFDLLYRLLWRLKDQPRLLQIETDPDVISARAMAKEVSRASHKMKAFVRFREAQGEDGQIVYVAWFEPPHYVIERTAPFFVRRFSKQKFSILSPDVSIHWDLEKLHVQPGSDRALAPAGDRWEDHWRTYYASIFNPARLKVRAMQSEMPKQYWRNLPEASLIPELIAGADARSREMVEAAPQTPQRKIRVAPPRPTVDDQRAPSDVADLSRRVQTCRRCPLWRDATQAVAGAGPTDARLFLVGEQPGDEEDLAGRPFIGPAGKVLDDALKTAGIARESVFITNAVKHFKHLPRGKRRLHKTPDASEVDACRWWISHELGLMRPKVVVALGAIAARSVLGRATLVGASRGRIFNIESGARAIVTSHPAYLLRLPDEKAKRAAREAFIADLKQASAMVSG